MLPTRALGTRAPPARPAAPAQHAAPRAALRRPRRAAPAPPARAAPRAGNGAGPAAAAAPLPASMAAPLGMLSAVPISVLTDSYKASHFLQYPETRKMVAVRRRGRLEGGREGGRAGRPAGSPLRAARCVLCLPVRQRAAAAAPPAQALQRPCWSCPLLHS
jgi:hypothetical protein